MQLRRLAVPVLTAMLAAGVACSADSTTGAAGTGRLAIRLTDAPFSFDSIASVDIFVVRVDAKQEDSDDAEVAEGASDDHATEHGWTTVATPNAAIDVLSLRDGVQQALGEQALAAGDYRSFRFVIDPSKSGVTLKNGTVLTSSSLPSVAFPSGSRSGIKVKLDRAIHVAEDGTTTMVIDFDLSNSFKMRGNSLSQHGLLFTPVIKATVSDAPAAPATPAAGGTTP